MKTDTSEVSEILIGQTHLNTYVHVSDIWELVLTLWLQV